MIVEERTGKANDKGVFIILFFMFVFSPLSSISISVEAALGPVCILPRSSFAFAAAANPIG